MSEQNNNYFDTSEAKCDEAFNFFCSKNRWYHHIKKMDKGSQIDYQCTSNKGNELNIELKLRHNNPTKYPTVFIELKKYYNLLNEYYKTGRLPIYINFFDNKNTLVMWDLSQKLTLESYPTQQLFDKGDKAKVTEPRLGLYINQGYMYKYVKDLDRYVLRTSK